MNIEIANRLLIFRKAKGYSQEELAEKIGVSRQAISKWERSEASPDTDNLIMLAKVYGVTLDELLQGDSEPGAEPSAEAVPDENTAYVKSEKVSFKNGIHVHNDDEQVDISFREGINVHSSDGSRVHVGADGIHVEDAEKVRVYTDENGNVMYDKNTERKKKKRVANLVPVWAIALAAMFIWGFSGVCYGWALAWICMLAIPLYHSLADAIYKRNPTHFAYPVLCVAEYMIAGFCNILGGWAYGWIVFITIPIYYAITGIIMRDKENEE